MSTEDQRRQLHGQQIHFIVLAAATTLHTYMAKNASDQDTSSDSSDSDSPSNRASQRKGIPIRGKVARVAKRRSARARAAREVDEQLHKLADALNECNRRLVEESRPPIVRASEVIWSSRFDEISEDDRAKVVVRWADRESDADVFAMLTRDPQRSMIEQWNSLSSVSPSRHIHQQQQRAMSPSRTDVPPPTTGKATREQCRDGIWNSLTAAIAQGHLQANLIILPSRYANDFTLLCKRNTVPCPLLASSIKPGDFNNFRSHIPGVSDEQIAEGIDIRTDAPAYNVYHHGKLTKHAVGSVEQYWDSNDHVAFLIGCSYSFEDALATAGLKPAHFFHGRSVSMYRTSIPLCPAGVFTGSTYVVSMRMYRASEIERVREVTRPYVATHGEPVAWGWDGMRRIGVQNLDSVDWGERPYDAAGRPIVQAEEEAKEDGLVPVFWGCGVTPQESVMRAKIPGTVIGHAPGHMVVLDVREDDVLGKTN
ncbi:uncharacterized protein LTR77_004744 [Saxophila tyrrhenica]|uniref:Uncharacterized protein n=1 Tax=Saxophila tyrrhenica TaxID=1690608 RepID=A0AAV9P9X0_9PEZI|nr:hypothetical protein LTR77_004744 [Saxophila tyrrhenica]